MTTDIKQGIYIDYDSAEKGKGRGRVIDVIEVEGNHRLVIEPNRKQSERQGDILFDIGIDEVVSVLRRNGNVQGITYR